MNLLVFLVLLSLCLGDNVFDEPSLNVPNNEENTLKKNGYDNRTTSFFALLFKYIEVDPIKNILIVSICILLVILIIGCYTIHISKWGSRKVVLENISTGTSYTPFRKTHYRKLSDEDPKNWSTTHTATKSISFNTGFRSTPGKHLSSSL